MNGPNAVCPPLYLGPMAGITDAPFRLLCFEAGADVCVTEMISAQGLMYAKKDAPVYVSLLNKLDGEGRLIAQIFGREPRYMQEAAQKLWEMGRFDGIDINMGCPAPKVTGGGNGSALMKTPELACQIVEAVKAAVPCPVSVKIRLGFDAVTATALAPMLAAAGADLLQVHGRTRTQQYGGKADWQAIGAVKRSVSIPVIANGDVFTADDAVAILQATGADGVMMARGALGMPWLFHLVKCRLTGQTPHDMTKAEILQLALRYAAMMREDKGETRAVIEMRKHFAWYLKGMTGAAEVRRRINTLAAMADVQNEITQFLTSN